MSDIILSTRDLRKHYGRIKAVDGLSLNIQKGQVFGILGPNGSGKTTTLGIVLGVINKTAGEYHWFGEEPTNEHRKRIGAILETPVFYPYLTGRQNLELVCLIKDAPKEKIEEKLQLVELAGRQDDKFKTYSLGMKQRLAIASALLADPEVLILDEPTNGLDPQGIAEIRGLIQKIAAEDKTIILASHLLDEVQKVCSHFAVLSKGKCLHTGPVEDVTKGIENVEVQSHDLRLPEVLKDFPHAEKISQENGVLLVKMKSGYDSASLNQFLFENKVVASHLVTRKKSLEKQFLEILKNNEEVAR
ncbi:MAG: ABC transporter ATP-binding protein [Candidatus Cyclobacteriaceae bacterium M2_1C_046]